MLTLLELHLPGGPAFVRMVLPVQGPHDVPCRIIPALRQQVPLPEVFEFRQRVLTEDELQDLPSVLAGESAR